MKRNFLITTGGSGGHVVPAMILCEHLSDKTNIIISTDKRGLKYLNKNEYKIEIINTPRLNNTFFLPFNLIIVFILTLKSLILLKNKKIENVLSTGGYMSLPVIWAARILKLNIFLIEPNQTLGRSNRYFLNSCKKIFCYTEKVKNFPENLKHKMVIIKPLVRKNIYDLSLSNKNKNKFSILIIGGSQGANIFDKKLKDSIVNLSKIAPIKVIQQTNNSNISALSDHYSKNKVENKIFSFDRNFLNNEHQIDLCITRAGASTLAELSVLNIPFIAVPLPTSKDNHQFENANFYKNKNCCWIIEQDYFDEKIEDFLSIILKNRTDYMEKKGNLKKLNYQNSWINVNQKILEMINEN